MEIWSTIIANNKHKDNQIKQSINQGNQMKAVKSVREIYSGLTSNAYVHTSKQEAPPSHFWKSTILILCNL